MLHILFDIVYVGFLISLICVTYFFAYGIYHYKMMMLGTYNNSNFSVLHPDDVPVVKKAIEKAKIRDRLWVLVSFILYLVGSFFLWLIYAFLLTFRF
jgi:hypothetical protein